MQQRVACADSRQVAKQRVRIGIAYGKPVYVQYRVTQAGPNHQIPDIMHIEKTIYMAAVIHPSPGIANLKQTVGPQRRKREQTILAKYPGYLAGGPARVV